MFFDFNLNYKIKIGITLIIIQFSINSVWGGEITRFQLNISHTQLDRFYENKIIPTKFNSIIGTGTEKLSENFKGSLIFGYQEQLQNENSVVAARYAIGYFLGFGINYSILRTENYHLTIPAKYRYHQLEGKDAGQVINITWYDVTLGIENYFDIGSNIQLLADLYVFKESGTERALEPISQSIIFENKSDITYSVGIAYNLKPSSSLAVKWLHGAEQGFQLLFESGI
jgi:hypothetical protein